MKIETNKRKHYSLEQKYNAIMAVENNLKSQLDIIKELGAKQSTVNGWFNEEEKRKIITAFQNNIKSSKRKRLRGSKYQDIDESLFEWMKKARLNNVPINGPILMKKADDFAVLLNNQEFHANNGWLERFKQRFNITYNSLNGESAKVSEYAKETWINSVLPSLIEGYEKNDIFNVDETGLFFKLKPNKTMSISGEKCFGGERSKERITILFCCNSDGSEKLKPIVIGKSKNPTCFKGINKSNLGVTYRFNGNAWMNEDIFQEWLIQFDEQCKRRNRNIILFLDNFSGHYTNANLSNIKLAFLPANTTSITQPLDQGIIQNFKLRYRSKIIAKIISRLDDEEEIIEEKITIKDAIDYIVPSWRNVTTSCIENCFRKAGINQFLREQQDIEINERVEEDILAQWDLIHSKNLIPNGFTIEEYVKIDEELATNSLLTDESIVKEILARDINDIQNGDEKNSDFSDNEENLSKITMAKVFDSISTIRSYLQSQEKNTEAYQISLDEIENFCEKNVELKQTLITNFFK